MEKIILQHSWVIILILVWTLPWKAAALWRSARRGHVGWFLALIILNTLAILDILYIFVFSKPRKKVVAETVQPQIRRFPREQEQQLPQVPPQNPAPRNRQIL